MFKINQLKNIEFLGNLSPANNGGFASVGSRSTSLQLREGDCLIINARGDGREYTLNLFTSDRRMAFSYQATFQTRKDTWIEVTVPLSEFVATNFGRVIFDSPPDPTQINGIGVLLRDKKPGPFKLEVESITVKRTNNGESPESPTS